MRLPTHDEISDHSRKFYDGTYTLVSNGFNDETGGKQCATEQAFCS